MLCYRNLLEDLAQFPARRSHQRAIHFTKAFYIIRACRKSLHATLEKIHHKIHSDNDVINST